MITQEIFNFRKVENMDWKDFIESSENQDALTYLIKWPNWNSNGVILTGNSGTGKTHLASLWAQSSNAIYILKESLNHSPRDIFQNNCNFVLDNFESFLQNEDWLFHFYNIAKEKSRYFIIIDRVSPSQWEISLKDLSSRLMSLPVLTIQEPQDELLFKISQKLAKDYEITIADDAINYILTMSERKVSTIADILKDLDKLSLQQKKSISLNFVRQYISQKNFS